jgi:hypothetical protein
MQLPETYKGRTIRNPGRGGGRKFPQKNSCKEKCLEKIRAAITSEKKNRASKQQIVNSLEIRLQQRLNALKKNPAET